MKIKITNKKKFWVTILLIVLVVQSAFIWISWSRSNTLWQQNNNIVGLYAKTNATTMDVKVYIQAAVKGIYSNQTVTDAVAKKVYIPEANLVLPMNDLSRSLFYHHEDTDSKTKTPVQFSFNTSFSLNRFASTFDQVPCAQRMAGFTINQKDGFITGGHYDGSKTLQDGRTLYFYSNATAGCNAYWGDYNAQAVVNLLKQAQSY